MKNLIPTIAIVGLALLVCWLGYTQQAMVEDLTETQACLQETQDVLADTADTADFAVQAAVGERIIKLPENGGIYYTTIAVSADWQAKQRERELVSWFSSQPELASLKAQTHFVVAEEGDDYYKWHLQEMEAMPGVMVQTDEGRVVYMASGDTLPTSSGEMAEELVTLFEKRPWLRLRPWKRPRPCPGPQPEPDPEPTPDVDVDVVVKKVPVIRPPKPLVAKGMGEDFWAILIVSILLAGVITVAVQWKSRVG